MASKYDELSNEYNVSAVELQKADITIAALLNGYMVKRGVLGKDETDMFFKMEKDRKLKSFALPVGEKQLTDTEEAVIDMQLGLKGKEIDDEYISGLVGSYDKNTIGLFVISTYDTLVENNKRDKEDVKSYYNDKLATILDINKLRNTSSESGRE